MVLDKISFGEVEVLNTGLAVVPDDSLAAQNPMIGCFFEEVDGLIGSNVMRYARWEIDHERQIITITDDPDAFPPAENSLQLPFKNTAQGVPLVTGSVNGEKDATFIVDTGASSYFQLHSQLLQKLEKKDSLPKTEIYGETASGIFGADKGTTNMVRVDKLTFGDIQLENVVAGSIESRFNLLGNAFMKNFKIVFDWDKEVLTFTPIDPDFQPPHQIQSFGLSYAYSDSMKGMYVSSLFSEGAAKNTYGLEVDLPIHSLSGNQTQEMTFSAFCQLLLYGGLDSLKQLPLEVMQGDSLREIVWKRRLFWRNSA